MDEGGFSDYRANLWLEQLVWNRTGSVSHPRIWVGLHYADPNVSGAYASEVFGGSYSRVSTTFDPADNRSVFNNVSIAFKGLPNVTISFIGGWDALHNGNLEFFVPLSRPVIIAAGKGYTIDAAMLAISLP